MRRTDQGHMHTCDSSVAWCSCKTPDSGIRELSLTLLVAFGSLILILGCIVQPSVRYAMCGCYSWEARTTLNRNREGGWYGRQRGDEGRRRWEERKEEKQQLGCKLNKSK